MAFHQLPVGSQVVTLADIRRDGKLVLRRGTQGVVLDEPAGPGLVNVLWDRPANHPGYPVADRSLLAGSLVLTVAGAMLYPVRRFVSG